MKENVKKGKLCRFKNFESSSFHVEVELRSKTLKLRLLYDIELQTRQKSGGKNNEFTCSKLFIPGFHCVECELTYESERVY